MADNRVLKPTFSLVLNNGEKVGRFKGSPAIVARKIAREILKENNDDISKVPNYVNFVKNDYGRTDIVYRYGLDVRRVNETIDLPNGLKFKKKFDINVWRA